MYYASVDGTTETGNVQGGAGCTAADVDARPFSPRLNIPKLDPYTVARQAQAAGLAVKTLIGKDAIAPDGTRPARSTPAAPTLACRQGPPAAASRRRWSLLGGIPAGWDFQTNGKTWRTQGQTQAGTYFVVGNADITANTGGVGGGNVALSVLAMGRSRANGNPDVIPHATVPFIGPILMIAGLRPRPRRDVRRRLRGPVLRAAPARTSRAARR